MRHMFSNIFSATILFCGVAAPCQSTRPTQTGPPTVSPGNGTNPSIGDAPSAPSAPTQPALLTRAKGDDALRVGGGDLLQVTVFGASDYNYDLRVAGDGSVNVPLIGLVHVGGSTTREIALDLQSRLSRAGYFNNPQVGVFVKEYATQGVSVLGEVQKPGVYPLLGARTLFDVISAAQGITQTAGDKVSIIHRDRPRQPELVELNFDDKDASQNNVPVFPGDTVVVQRAGMAYVVGDVQKPTGIVMTKPNLTVLQALALAQGTNPNAALDRARIVRKTNDGQTEIPLHLKKMLSAQVPDVRVQPDDVIFVPNSAMKTGFKYGLQAAIATVTGIIIYR